MNFNVNAVRGAGDVVALTIAADDAAQARRAAAEQGWSVVSLHPSNPLQAWLRRSRSDFGVELFIQELVSLLDAGLSLVEAVDLLAEKEQGRSAGAVLNGLRAALQRGLSFSAALELQGAVFPPLLIATVRAAERTGDLQEAATRFLEYQEQIDRVRRKVISASIYPCLLLGVGALVTAFMLLYVVPRFSRVYAEIGGEMPFLTRLLIGWGGLLEAHATLAIPAAGAALAAAWFTLSRPGVRRWIAAQLWKMPAVGERLRVYELARFYRTLGMLLKSGVALPAALDMSGALLPPVLRLALQRAAREVREGQPVSRAFARQGLTTQVSLRLLGVGEQTGRMPQMVERSALFYEDELARWIDWFTRLFEPALMVLVGALVGLIVVLLYLPIFELAENMK
ncbi:MAG: type II secretion system F family protein [Burkholderiaceae bacterium]